MSDPLKALEDLVHRLISRDIQFAVVGGVASSIRGEVRTTFDLDVAVIVADDAGAEALIHWLARSGYAVVALVEHKERARLSTVRLRSPSGVITDLLFASCGIEREVVERATPVRLGNLASVPVARSEELIAMKLLSMSERRPNDRVDICNLVAFSPNLDLASVGDNLRTIIERGYGRNKDLVARWNAILTL